MTSSTFSTSELLWTSLNCTQQRQPRTALMDKSHCSFTGHLPLTDKSPQLIFAMFNFAATLPQPPPPCTKTWKSRPDEASEAGQSRLYRLGVAGGRWKRIDGSVRAKGYCIKSAIDYPKPAFRCQCCVHRYKAYIVHHHRSQLSTVEVMDVRSLATGCSTHPTYRDGVAAR